MKVLLTGASGFIGAQTCRALLEAGCEVGAIVRGKAIPPRLQTVVSDYPSLTLLRGDLYAFDSVRQAVLDFKPEVCLHLAWYVETGKCLQSSENLLALNAGFHLLQTLSEAGCRRIITTGTCAEYNTEEGWLNEDSLTRPETLYAATKLSLHLVAQQMARNSGMQQAHARIFYVYGPYEDDKRVVPALIRSLHAGVPFAASSGTQVRDYLHVADVAAALCRLAQTDVEGVVNIASGVPVTIRELMQTIGEEMDCLDLIRFGAVPPRAWDPCFICGDNTRLRALGWQPRYALREGLRQTIDWWRHNMS